MNLNKILSISVITWLYGKKTMKTKSWTKKENIAIFKD